MGVVVTATVDDGCSWKGLAISKTAGRGSNHQTPTFPFGGTTPHRKIAMVNVWLDDERDPNSPRIQELFGSEAGMIWAKTVPAAINWLKSNHVSWISLDHDLGTTATGYDVAKWIEERAYSGELTRVVWTIHSANVEGSRAMRAALRNADRIWSQHEAG